MSSLSFNAQNALVSDVQSLNSLKTQSNDPKAAREAAKQLESLFMREMIKSMRDATMKSGLLDNSATSLANDMYDQQMSVAMSGMPRGLSDAITAQISRSIGKDNLAAANVTGEMASLLGDDNALAQRNFSMTSTLSFASQSRAATSLSGSSWNKGSTPAVDAYAPPPKGRDSFVQAHLPSAQRVAQESGIPASFMVGQAGHETGWGKSAIRNADGSNSFNLFGIKAGKGWSGKVAEVTTTEYIDGVPRKVKAKFRAYDSYEDSFRDYARLITENPRYEQAQNVASAGSANAYAKALQQAGYATDPQYANKLTRAIESAVAVQRSNQA
ncbi:flagellar assembly peptidoglycan hydrolase FlgJ [Comamonas sp. UBA7528]|jgi:flagellar protein FlgJ|uniref:flagellar assembly peptidoglycan hydrolase FlgJ n=1 Tax=Comamonas sp. UBA7528 TaxID=1946391 RepID=UPI0025BD110C|nr:flagellar assembly peptidoglycan hydrolase FlgJ [Comamonas sp. UBA7528]